MPQFIKTYENALSPALCDEIVARFEASQDKAVGRVGGGVDKEKKHSTDLSMSNPAWSDLNNRVMASMFKATQEYLKEFYFLIIGTLSPMMPDPRTNKHVTLNEQNFERLGAPKLDQLMRTIFRCSAINVQRYKKGEGGYPLWHSEIYPLDSSCEQLHRSLLFLIYLNDIEEGGETEFRYQQLKVKPKKGSIVIAPAGFTHTHRGNVPISDDKYVLAGWVLFNRAEQIYGKK